MWHMDLLFIDSWNGLKCCCFFSLYKTVCDCNVLFSAFTSYYVIVMFYFQPLQAIVCGRCEEEEDERPFYVLSGTQFQKWNISHPLTEKVSIKFGRNNDGVWLSHGGFVLRKIF